MTSQVAIALRLDDNQMLRHRFWQALSATGQVGPTRDTVLEFRDEVVVAPGSMPPDDVRGILAAATEAVERELDALRQSQTRDEDLRAAVETAARKRASR